MGEMMMLMLSGLKKNSILNKLTKHLLQSCSMHNTSLYIPWGPKKKKKIIKFLVVTAIMVLIYLCFVYAPQCLANRKCLITGASYTYHYPLAHLGSSVALWHPHCGNYHFPLFLQPDSKPCTRRCFPLLCPLLMLSPKSSILPSPDTKLSMSLY